MRKEPSHSEGTTVGATRRVAPVDHHLEYSEYNDEGCGFSPSCLKCPLPKCRLDVQAEGRRTARLLRDREIIRKVNVEGKSIAEMARTYGLSRRTIHRIVRRSSHD